MCVFEVGEVEVPLPYVNVNSVWLLVAGCRLQVASCSPGELQKHKINSYAALEVMNGSGYGLTATVKTQE